MLVDDRLELADSTALSTGTGRQLVGDVIDIERTGTVLQPNDLGTSADLFLIIQIDTSVASGGAATVSFELVSDAQSAIATDGSATLHWASGDIAKAALVAGKTFAVQLPPGNYERYLGVIANVGTAALTAGKVNAWLGPDASAPRIYPNNYQ